MPSANPFLDPSFKIRWSALAPEFIELGIEEALASAKLKLEAIESLPLSGLTYANTALALEQATEELGMAWGKVTHLQSVADSPALRQAHNRMLPKVSSFQASIPFRPALWERLKAYSATPEALSLVPVRARYLEETLADFRLAGADLPLDKKTRLEALQAELAQITQTFSENVLDSTNAWQLVVEDERRLEGLPEHAKAAARASATEKGLGAEKPVWRFTLHMPSLEPFMTYVRDEGLRREMWEAGAGIGSQGKHDNSAIIQRVLALRAEKATLLGKNHFADLVLSRRMAKTGAAALHFIEDLRPRCADAFEKEARELEQFKAAQTGEPAKLLAPWDLAFWSERLRKDRYDFDEEELRPYLPMKRVMDGMFEVCSRIFAIRVVERPSSDVETWHPLVTYYDVFDSRERHIGSFFADWYPRDSKRGGAWMNHLITGGPAPDGSRKPHLGLICGNMTPASSDRPSLLTHREAETIFHEFGHLLHHLMGEVEIKSLNGTNVAWDFVELPSQIMENWCWEREGLDLFARHHQTGERIPDQLYNKMIAAKNFRSASATMRQIAFAKMDLILHTRTPEFAGHPDLEARIRKIVSDCLIPTEPPAPTILRRFTHIFGDPVGYAAGYYSYKWAEVLDADAFTRFKREGIFSPKVGSEFVSKILSRGNAEDPGRLFRDFMGRDPDLTALLVRSGLAG